MPILAQVVQSALFGGIRPKQASQPRPVLRQCRFDDQVGQQRSRFIGIKGQWFTIKAGLKCAEAVDVQFRQVLGPPHSPKAPGIEAKLETRRALRSSHKCEEVVG